jgi:hypothetical protein
VTTGLDGPDAARTIERAVAVARQRRRYRLALAVATGLVVLAALTLVLRG